jgi:hypothetical protein
MSSAPNKSRMNRWPWNGQPSSRHVWREVRTEAGTGAGYTSRCERCGRSFVARADTRAPIYCYPTKEWLAAHPEDDAREGP